MDNRTERLLEERIAHLEVDIKMDREWNDTPKSRMLLSKGRFEQIRQEMKSQESRRLGFPKNKY